MGALTDQRKRSSADFRLPLTPIFSSSTKKPRLSSPTHFRSAKVMPASFPSNSHHPQPSPPSRYIHAPQRIIHAFGLGSSLAQRQKPSRATGTVDLSSQRIHWKPDDGLALHEYRKLADEHIGSPGDEPLNLNSVSRANGTVDFSSQRIHRKPDEGLALHEYIKLVEEHIDSPGDEPLNLNSVWRRSYSPELKEAEPFHSSAVPSPREQNDISGALELEPMRKERAFVKSEPLYKKLHEKAKQRDPKLLDLIFKVKVQLQKVIGFRNEAEVLVTQEEKPKEDLEKLLGPLIAKEEEDLSLALFSGSSRDILVKHESSNIVITREVMQCLRPGAWLNDEVINLYLELLKERERREPKKFLKCHFFSTFFYKRLISEKHGYDFKAVKRWTTQRKLGYALIECDKIFIPIHKEIHWCLAVINVKDESFQYLDSLGGLDKYALKMLARYLMDEVEDKSAKKIDTLSWKKESVDELPLQKNGWDCGMFMLKYADFYSRGLNLCFSQEHMPYFRKRTALEILRLKAE